MIDQMSERKITSCESLDNAGDEVVNTAGSSSNSLAGGMAAMAITAGVVFGGYAVTRMAVTQVKKLHQPA